MSWSLKLYVMRDNKISCAAFKQANNLAKVQVVTTNSNKKRVLCFPVEGEIYDIPASGDCSLIEAPSFILTEDGTWIGVNTSIQVQKRGVEF